MRAESRVVHVVLHAASWAEEQSAAVVPLHASVLALTPWPEHVYTESLAQLLAWLGQQTPKRPLLGLTGRPLHDNAHLPLRGGSLLSQGLAVVSSFELDERALVGTLRHELAHAFGLDHCEVIHCVMSERPWPLDVCDRSGEFCPSCRQRWLALTSQAAG